MSFLVVFRTLNVHDLAVESSLTLSPRAKVYRITYLAPHESLNLPASSSRDLRRVQFILVTLKVTLGAPQEILLFKVRPCRLHLRRGRAASLRGS
jgi:hypothetical protein